MGDQYLIVKTVCFAQVSKSVNFARRFEDRCHQVPTFTIEEASRQHTRNSGPEGTLATPYEPHTSKVCLGNKVIQNQSNPSQGHAGVILNCRLDDCILCRRWHKAAPMVKEGVEEEEKEEEEEE